tara:strand:+ start:32707 stop:33549 length:843 start_codon:yes stop_codon:yes gene_type:complete
LKRTIGLIILLLSPVAVTAATSAENANGTSTATLDSQQQVESKFKISTTFSYSSNLYADGEFEKATDFGMDAIPSYKLTDKLTASARIILNQDLAGVGDTTLNNIRLRLSQKSYPIGGNLKMSPRISAYLPTNERNRIDKKYFGGAAIGLLFTTDQPFLGLDWLYGPTLKKDFHEFETDNLNRENVEYALSHGFEVSRALGDKWTLGLGGTYQTGQTYRGTLKNQFALEEYVSCQVNKTFSVTVGHTNEGNAFRYDGVSNNIEVYDEATSTVYMSLSIKN